MTRRSLLIHTAALRRAPLVLLLIGILLTSCGGQAAGEPTPDVNLTIAAGAETMVAALFETQTALAPAATNTALPTMTFLPTSTALALPLPAQSTPTVFVAQPVFLTPTPTGTFYTATPVSSSLAVGCNNLAVINTYTKPTGPFSPGQEFTQFWQVENNGTCDWVYLNHLVFVSGDQMKGSPGRLSKVIPPGKWTTLSVDLDAPNKDGTHTASWRFSDAGGTPFGATLGVSIVVKKNPDPTSTPNAAQTQAAAVQQTVDAAAATAGAAAQQTAVQSSINTAVAQTQTQAAIYTAAGSPPPYP